MEEERVVHWRWTKRLVEQTGIYAENASKQRLSCRLQETAVPQVDVFKEVGGKK
jgi:hypothetical protein